MPFDRPSLPPSGCFPLDSWTVSTLDDLRDLRAGLMVVLAGQRLPAGHVLDAVPDRVVLVASELATNALCHGRPPARVRLHRADAAFLVDVSDGDLGHVPTRKERPGAVGYGLRIADRLAEITGWYVDRTLKHVWARFPLPDRRSASR